MSSREDQQQQKRSCQLIYSLSDTWQQWTKPTPVFTPLFRKIGGGGGGGKTLEIQQGIQTWRISKDCLQGYKFKGFMNDDRDLLPLTFYATHKKEKKDEQQSKGTRFVLQIHFSGGEEQAFTDVEIKQQQKQVKRTRKMAKWNVGPPFVDSWSCHCLEDNEKEKNEKKDCSIATVTSQDGHVQKHKQLFIIVTEAWGISLNQYIRDNPIGETERKWINHKIAQLYSLMYKHKYYIRFMKKNRILIDEEEEQLRFFDFEHVGRINDEFERIYGNLIQLSKKDIIIPLYREQFSYIKGPITLSEHYDAKREMRVYIFGDLHLDLKRECPIGPETILISELFRQVLQNNANKTIDIYLEVGLKDKQTGILRSIDLARPTKHYGFLFDQVMEEWETCLQQSKTQCRYPNLRMHYTDARQLSEGLWDLRQVAGRIGSDIGKFATNLFTARKLIQSLNEIVPNFEHAIQLLHDEFPKKSLNVDKIVKRLKIDKQLNAIYKDSKATHVLTKQYMDTFIKDKDTPLLSYDLLESWLTEFKKFVQLDVKEDVDELTINLFADKMEPFTDKFKKFCDDLMDVYTMARLFRTYSSTKKDKQQYSERAKYAIIYVGDYHAGNYRKTLDTLGFEVVNQTKAKKTQCLDVSDFHQPFFTQ